MGDISETGERFLDNEKIEGTIPQMLDRAISFTRRNMRTRTIVNENTGRREDRTDYPVAAVRETVINALVHRDYSIHTEGMPVQLILFQDRLEVRSPGGLYGRLTTDQLEKVQPDTRNPVLVSALEVLHITENRYSGIPTIRRTMKEYHLREPVFQEKRGQFITILYREETESEEAGNHKREDLQKGNEALLQFLHTPRSRKEVVDYLGLKSASYAIRKYIDPLVEAGLVHLSVPDKPGSPKQRYYSD